MPLHAPQERQPAISDMAALRRTGSSTLPKSGNLTSAASCRTPALSAFRHRRREALSVEPTNIMTATATAAAVGAVGSTTIVSPMGSHTSLGGNLRNISTDAQQSPGCASEYTRAPRQPARAA